MGNFDDWTLEGIKMTFSIIFLVISIIASIILLKWGEKRWDGIHSFFGLIGFFLAGFSGLAAFIGIFAAFNYVASGVKADIINRAYGTSYTQEEVFYAKDIIEEIRHIQRNRNEIDLKVEIN